MLTVEFVGGLGNQLFQLAAVDHIGRRSGRAVVIESAGTSGHSNENYFNSLFGHWSVARNPPQFPLNIQEGSYVFSDWRSALANSHNVRIHGYFQNWQYVHVVMPQIYSELVAMLTKVSGIASIQLGDSVYGVVHFRRGDLLNYGKTMGVLDDDYFLKAITYAFTDLNQRVKLVVLTDDKEAGEKTFASLADEVYGPDDVDEWEALRIMSNAIFVVTSNSTFSWWGALLSSKNGGTAYVPSPWFLDWSPNPGEAFTFPSFKKVPAQFTY